MTVTADRALIACPAAAASARPCRLCLWLSLLLSLSPSRRRPRLSLPAPPAPAPGLCCHGAPSPALQHLRRSPGSGTSPAEPVSVSPPLVPPQPRRSLPATLPRKLGRGRCRERTAPAGGSTGTSLPGTAGEENGDAMG